MSSMNPKKYSLFFITNIPSFYKLNLYNAINEHVPVFVLFTGDLIQERERDFFNGDFKFDYVSLSGLSKFRQIQCLIRLLRRIKYDELVLGGWDSILLWISAIFSSKRKNSVAIESSYLESNMSGLKGVLKRLFIRRISRVYASGKSQAILAKDMGYSGDDIIITKGVGVFNYIQQPPFVQKQSVKKFIYVGRLSEEKNLELLISVFNNLPELELNIIGYGHLKDQLMQFANDNISFIGSVDNKELPHYYQSNDVFILPSYSEPWGLVVEEALNNGLPVILSDRIGCAEEILIEGKNGFTFKWNSEASLLESINRITDPEIYNSLSAYISTMDFQEIARRQVNCYIHE